MDYLLDNLMIYGLRKGEKRNGFIQQRIPKKYDKKVENIFKISSFFFPSLSPSLSLFLPFSEREMVFTHEVEILIQRKEHAAVNH